MDSGARAYAGQGAVRPRVSNPDAGDDDAGTESASDIWTLIALPDTQYYAELDPEILESQVDWILRTADELDTRFVIHLGDIVDNNVEVEWQRAASSLKKLSGRIPFSLAVGNHDLGIDGVAHFRRPSLFQIEPADIRMPGESVVPLSDEFPLG